MSDSFDLLIVGGGIYGATAACEASRRGLSWLLIERDDFGAGASSSSLKIAHGGLRYLQSVDLGRSLESMRERRRLLRAAPRFVQPLRCRLDTTSRRPGYRLLLRAGLALNDLVSLRRNRGVRVDRRLPRSRYPIWYDALIEDTERLLWAFLHSAREWSTGPCALHNHTRLVALERDGERYNVRASGLPPLRARAVLRCVGATRPAQPVMLAMNLVVDELPLHARGEALALRHPDDGRNLFVVPWRGRSMVGTYNRSYPHPPEQPFRFEAGWVDEFLRWAAPAHPDLAQLTRARVRLVHAGVLPLAPGEEAEPSDSFWIRRNEDGAIDVQGVKWTTAWGVAERALDLVERTLGREPRAGRAPERPLVDPLALREEFVAQGPAYAAALRPGYSDLRRGDVLFALERERARDLADVLLRRTGSAAAGHPGTALVRSVADLLQAQRDWSEREKAAQIEAFHSDFRFAGNVRKD